jgi:prephenate dehydrogenase
MIAAAETPIRRLVIIGVGLIGGSLARALRDAGAVQEVIGVARSAATGEKAIALGVIDRFVDDPRSVVEDASVVVIATPVGSFAGVLEAIAPHLNAATVVTDVGSVKQYVVDTARRCLGANFRRFVPGHPIAGTERSGVQASVSDLFRDRHVVLTPVAATEPMALRLVTHMWESTGADVLEMDVTEHDLLLAATSHLPHVIAYALVHCLARHPDRGRLFELAAGGFYDFTRIASSDPIMWRDICLTNKEPLLQALNTFQTQLDAMVEAIGEQRGEQLESWFKEAKLARDAGLDSKRDKRN